MDIKVGAGKLILVLLSLGLVQAENWARLRSINGDCESAKGLKWIAESDTVSLENAVVGCFAKDRYGEEFKLHICRARGSVGGKWVSGTLLPNQFCQIVADGEVYDVEHYEVLHHVNGASHFLWKNWHVDSEIPAGAVCVDDEMMIARKKDGGSSRTYWIGNVNLLQSPIIIIPSENYEIQYFEDGQVLLEIKPKFYNVITFEKLDRSEGVNSMNETVKLGEITLRNVLQGSTKVESIIPFEWLHRSKWIPECDECLELPQEDTFLQKLIPGTDSNIFQSDKIESIKWDTPKEEIQCGSHSVFTDLEAETEVQVTLQAKLVEKKDFFKGTVIIYYEGGDYYMFDVPIVYQQTALNDFELVYGQKFNLNKNSTTTETDSYTPETSSTTTSTDSSNPLISFMTTTPYSPITSTSPPSPRPTPPTTTPRFPSTRTLPRKPTPPTTTPPFPTTTYSPTPITSTDGSKFIHLNIKMNIKIGVVVLIIVLLSLGSVQAENWAQLRSINDDYESAKGLKWIPENDNVSLEDAVVGSVDNDLSGEDVKLHICRARKSVGGKWVSGTLLPNRVCQIVANRYVYDVEHYEVLHHVNGASHLLWKDWHVFNEIPIGAVCVDDKMMIARKKNKGSSRSYWIGNVKFQSHKIIVSSVNHKLGYFEHGQVLVEIKPTSYHVLTYDKCRSEGVNSMYETVKLGEITLRNVLQRSTEVKSIIPFQWLYRSKWISECDECLQLSEENTFLEKLIPGTDSNIFELKGNSRENERIKWDTLKEEIQYGNYSIFTDLEAETEVQVTLQAKLVEKKDFFVGSVSIYYEGGSYFELYTPIVHQQTALEDFELVYGQKFNLNKNFTTTNTDSLTITNSSTPETGSTITTGDSSTLEISSPTITTDSSTPETGSTITTRDSSTLEISSPTITTDSSTPETSSIKSTTDSSTLEISSNTTTTDSSTPETSSITSTTGSSTLDTSSNTTTTDSSTPETGSTITTRDSSTLEISSPTITTDSSTPETSSITSTTDYSTLETSSTATSTDSSNPVISSMTTTTYSPVTSTSPPSPRLTPPTTAPRFPSTRTLPRKSTPPTTTPPFPTTTYSPTPITSTDGSWFIHLNISAYFRFQV
ncbi:hypothetical protein V9T40_003632 [Parthenolecanium corni]|uniref:Uncharacterized protein n=1 Tax=Parthenolecanium corni TaxID=536013 RepID=A0AAN9Y850_9HEMI